MSTAVLSSSSSTDPGMGRVRLVVADDHPVVRSGIVGMFASEADLAVVGEAADGAQAVELVAELAPDVVLMDLRMPGVDGVEAIRRISAGAGTAHGAVGAGTAHGAAGAGTAAHAPAPRIVVLTTYDTDGDILRAVEAGAIGYLLKDSAREDILAAANEKAQALMQAALDARKVYLQMAEEDITGIAMHVVERILPQHFIDVPQMVLPVVRDAILRVKDQKEIVVHVPPNSYDFVLMARDELRSILTAGDSDLSITSDEGLRPGDCLVETPNGSVDARLQTQIEQLKKAVREVML